MFLLIVVSLQKFIEILGEIKLALAQNTSENLLFLNAFTGKKSNLIHKNCSVFMRNFEDSFLCICLFGAQKNLPICC